MDRKTAASKAKALVAQMTLEEKVSQMRYQACAIPRLGIPEYNWWNEALHGVARAGTATSFPQAIGMAAMFDDELLERIGDTIATEGRAKYNAHVAEGLKGHLQLLLNCLGIGRRGCRVVEIDHGASPFRFLSV